MPSRPAAGLELSDHDQWMLQGGAGAGAALAMRVLARAAEAMRAASLVDISCAHVDGCIYVGTVSTDFVRRLAEGGARVAVSTTLNVGSVDLLHPGLFRGEPGRAAAARELMDLHASLGCRPTWTCAPYQLHPRPGLGEHVAWGESNAIVFANSVLGARTQRYGDFLDLCCAIAGRAPFAGLHQDEPRLGRVLVRVDLPERLLGQDIIFPLIGHVLGRLCDGEVAVLDGIPQASEDDLKALGAAAASTGSVALFHMAGVTPEAPTVTAAFGGRAPLRRLKITMADLQRARAELTTGSSRRLGAVCLGTPHFSVAEFGRLGRVLAGRRARVPLYVNTSRHVLAEVTEQGWHAGLEEAGVVVVTDTCTYLTPIIGQVDGAVMTNSAKWAWYAPGNIGVTVVFGGLEECVESAVRGEVRVGALG